MSLRLLVQRNDLSCFRDELFCREGCALIHVAFVQGGALAWNETRILADMAQFSIIRAMFGTGSAD